MFRKSLKKSFLVATSVALLSTNAFAASGTSYVTGSLNNASTESATIGVSLTIPAITKIVVSDDIAFADLSDGNIGGDHQASINLCVYSSSGSFDVKIDSVNTDAAGTFKMKNDADERIPYALNFNDGSTGLNLTEGAATNTGFASHPERGCGSLSSTLTATISSSDLDGDIDGVYSDTLTMTVEVQW